MVEGAKAELPRIKMVRSRSELRTVYRLSDFFEYDDSDFVLNAYSKILQRSPDDKGFAYFLKAYREGILSKLEILARLRFSKEGRKHRVRVRGLLARFMILGAYHISVSRALRWALGANGLGERLASIETYLGYGTCVSPVSSLPAHPTERSTLEPQRIDIWMMLHQCRSVLLRAMPAGATRFLSAGCSGRWYFDWIEHCYGHVHEHIGIEYFMPRPANLPANVKWIANTACDMSDVASGTCDLVFSGQNLEHLWPDEAAAFLLEAARVLRPGGHIVVDSPNRAVTAALKWSNPEHTIELTVREVSSLLTLAGFQVTKSAGIWLCRDPRTHRLLPFDPEEIDPEWSTTERVMAAYSLPHYSFIWWLEARRTCRLPQKRALEEMFSGLFRENWPERVQRLVLGPGRRSDWRAGEEWIVVPAEEPGLVFHGPNVPLRAGRYHCTFHLKPPMDTNDCYAVCEVIAGLENIETLARHEVTGRQGEVIVAFTLDGLRFGIQFRCSSLGRSGFEVRRRILLQEQLS